MQSPDATPPQPDALVENALAPAKEQASPRPAQQVAEAQALPRPAQQVAKEQVTLAAGGKLLQVSTIVVCHASKLM